MRALRLHSLSHAEKFKITTEGTSLDSLQILHACLKYPQAFLQFHILRKATCVCTCFMLDQLLCVCVRAHMRVWWFLCTWVQMVLWKRTSACPHIHFSFLLPWNQYKFSIFFFFFYWKNVWVKVWMQAQKLRHSLSKWAKMCVMCVRVQPKIRAQ